LADQHRRVAILNTPDTPRHARHHLICIIQDMLRNFGVEVIHLYGTDTFVPADLLFVHYDRSVVPAAVTRFAQRYPLHVNAHARDIRKHTYVDGLLSHDSLYEGPVIVKSTLNYGGEPELNARSLLERVQQRAGRLAGLKNAPLMRTKKDYRVFDHIREVPGHYFSRHYVVQKFLPETDGEKNVLREYIFLGNYHFENIERSTDLIINEDENVSCLPFQPHARLLHMRNRLKLDYGKIDYTMIDGKPFIFDANKTLGLGEFHASTRFGDNYSGMLSLFALEIIRILNDPGIKAHGPDASWSALRTAS